MRNTARAQRATHPPARCRVGHERGGGRALRETQEEANARVEIDTLYTIFSLPHISQVYVFYKARLLDLDFFSGIESLETKLFAEADIPWSELSFAAITQTLEHFFSDQRRGVFITREATIDPRPNTA